MIRAADTDLFGNPTAVGIKVKLDRDIDRAKPCCDSIAVIYPGKAQHAGEFRCAGCGSHRGWCSHATRNFIFSTVWRWGAPDAPVTVRQSQEKTMAFEQKNFSGSVFVNDRKTEDRHPDRTGCALIDGVEYWVSGWLHKTKKGQPYLSLSFKQKNADIARPKKSRTDDLDDQIPFS